MFKFLKKLFTKATSTIVETVKTVKEKSFDEESLKDLRLNYVLELGKFNDDWNTGNGDYDYKKGVNHQWYGPESVTLDDDEIILKSVYNPVTELGDRFEYRVGRVSSVRDFYYGYYKFNIWLPESSFMNPKIELLGDGDTVTLMSGYSNVFGEYFKFETKVDGKDEEVDSVLNLGEYNEISCLYTPNGLKIYYNGLMVRSVKGFSFGEKVKVSVINSLQPEVEGIIVDDSEFKVKGLTYYRHV